MTLGWKWLTLKWKLLDKAVILSKEISFSKMEELRIFSTPLHL